MQNLLFITGRIRAKEAELINAQAWQQLAEAENLNSWLEQLKNTPYANFIAEARNFEAFEAGLNNYFYNLKIDLFNSREYSFADLLWSKYDFHNFKIFLKMKIGHKDLKKYLLPFGQIPLKTLEAFFLGSEKVNLNLHWLKLLHEAEAVYQSTGSFAAMNIFLDKTYYAEVLEKIKLWPKEIKYFYAKIIDSVNLKIWLQLKQDQEMELDYLTGGQISVKAWRLMDSLKNISQQVFPGLILDETENPADIQKKVDDYLSRFLFKQRFVNKSIIPLLVYFRAKEIEIKNLKTGYLKQAKQLASLNALMRETYV